MNDTRLKEMQAVISLQPFGNCTDYNKEWIWNAESLEHLQMYMGKKKNFGKVAILPLGTCPALSSKQGRFAGRWWTHRPAGLSESRAVAKGTHFKVPVPHLPVKVADCRFSEWSLYAIIKSKKAEKELRRLPVHPSSQNKTIPKWPWQVFGEGMWPIPVSKS